MIAYELHISGKVQEVYYRVSSRDKAQRLGLVGYVENLPDGRVHIVLEGDAKQCDELIAWCRSGPPLARVDHLEIRSIEVKGYDAFGIRRI